MTILLDARSGRMAAQFASGGFVAIGKALLPIKGGRPYNRAYSSQWPELSSAGDRTGEGLCPR
ncbi:MAG: hypothetical protein ABSE69_19210 [Roseiarcus sp.]